MDLTTSKLIMLCYGVFAVILCAVGYSYYRARAEALQLPEVVLSSQAMTNSTASGREAASRRLRFELARQRKRIDELQTLLNKRESVVQLQESRIKQNDQRFEALQREADEYLDLLFEVIQSSALNVDNLARMEGPSPLDDSGQDGDESTETLRMALDASQWELEQSMVMAEQNAAEAAAAQARLSVLQQAVVEMGEVSVPLLIGLLGDRDIEVRVWAARSLGQLGVAGASAIDALNVAAEDAEQSVREAANNAIRVISDSF